MRIALSLLIATIAVPACCMAQPGNQAAPHVIVYKTKHDYRKLVPVTMNNEHTAIVSFPDPSDLRTGDTYPVGLHQNYLLDKRGVGKNTVFLNMTYMAYSKLKTPPDPAAMLKMIKDKHPFTALYDCGNAYTKKDVVKETNALIDSKKIGRACAAFN